MMIEKTSKEKEEISDYQLADIINKIMSLIPTRMTPMGIMKIARTIEREYFKMYLGAYPEQIDDVLAAQASIYNEFYQTLKAIADQNFKNFKEANK